MSNTLIYVSISYVFLNVCVLLPGVSCSALWLFILALLSKRLLMSSRLAGLWQSSPGEGPYSGNEYFHLCALVEPSPSFLTKFVACLKIMLVL